MNFKSERGYSLIGVLLIITIVAIVGTSLAAVTLQSVKTSTKERDNQAVYYIAEAGMNYYTNEIDKLINEAYELVKLEHKQIIKSENVSQQVDEVCRVLKDKFYQELENNLSSLEENSPTFEEVNGFTPSAKILYDLEKDNNKLEIFSKGYIGEENRSVSKTYLINDYIECELSDVENKELPPLAVLTKGKMTLGPGEIIGSIGTNSTERNVIVVTSGSDRRVEHVYVPNIKGNSENESCSRTPTEKYKAYSITRPEWENTIPCPTVVESDWAIPELPRFPEVPNYNCLSNGHNGIVKDCNVSVNSNSGKMLSLNSDVLIKSLKISDNETLEIDLNDKDRTIVVDKFNVSGSMKIKGNGTLNLYIRDEFNLSHGEININGSSKNLNIFYTGSKAFFLSGAQKIYGSLYVKNADINLTASGGIMGNIFSGGNSIILNGDASATSKIVFAPKAKVELSGSGKVKGRIISKLFTMSGGASVEFIDCVDNNSSACEDFVNEGPISPENLEFDESQNNSPKEESIDIKFNGYEIETTKIKEINM